ncbi:MAG: hypothetical protein M0Z87_04070, partial [Actinomycetota bacterium]|nr:hypothetical protein [Actinomycetota bacterium]
MSRDGGPGTDRKGVHSVLLAAAWGRPDEQGLATSALAVGLASLGSVDVVVVGGAQGAASVDARLRLFGSPPSGLPQPVPSVVMAALRATALPPDAAREPARRWRRPASCARFVDELPVAAWRESGKFARMLEPDVVVVAGESGPAGVEAVAAAGEVGLVACAPLLDLPVPLPHTDEHVLLEVADVVLASSSVEAAAVETLVPRLDARNLVLLGSCLPAEPVSVVPFPRVVPPGLDPKAREPVLAEAPDVVVLAHDPFPGPDPGAAHPLRRSDERAAVRAGWLASVLA